MDTAGQVCANDRASYLHPICHAGLPRGDLLADAPTLLLRCTPDPLTMLFTPLHHHRADGKR